MPSEIKLIDIQKVILTRSYRVSYRTLTFIAESGNGEKNLITTIKSVLNDV